jgi:hypothetical protein
MSQLDRRDFVGTLSLAGLAGLTGHADSIPATTAGGGSPAVDGREDVTRSVAKYVVSGTYDDLPDAVRREARRTLLNWMGCAVGGSRHETLDADLRPRPFSGPPRASVLGRRERMDILHASLMNGISSHVFDSTTHLRR